MSLIQQVEELEAAASPGPWSAKQMAGWRVMQLEDATLAVLTRNTYMALLKAVVAAPCEKTGLYTRLCDGDYCLHCTALAAVKRALEAK